MGRESMYKGKSEDDCVKERKSTPSMTYSRLETASVNSGSNTMIDLQRPKPLDITYPARRTLWILGLYSGKGMKKHPLHTINFVVVILILFLFPVLILVGFLLHKQDVSVYLDALHYLLPHIWMIIKLFIYLRYRSSLAILEDLLDSEELNVQTKRQDRLISKAITIQKVFAGSLLSMGWMFTLIFAMLPFFNDQILSVPIWMPLDFGELFYHVYESIFYVILVCIYSAIDSKVIGYIAIVTAQLEILRNNLENFAERIPGENFAVQEMIIQRRLKNCIVHHNAIIGFIRKVEKVFSFIVFYQVLFSVLGICLTGIQFTSISAGDIKFTSECVYLLGMLFQIFSPCWFAQDIIVQSSGIIQSCFMSDWHLCTPSTRKMVFLVMERAKKPIVLRAGPFLTLSVNTFVMILRNGYSYYAVLSSLYEK